jgi:serine/threonine protein kinase
MSLPDPIIGKKLGDYTIRSLLGRGGMARVYKGYDERLDRYAAVKVITSDFVATADETEYKDRFEREAKAIARLRHANIVGVYQFGDIDGLYYMAMHFLDGEDLRIKLKSFAEKSERMPAKEIAKMAREVCSALDYAHENGVIHRDIKPSNIMMTSSGAALTDFGLALSTAEGTMGDTFGSAHYIAPEQAISSARAVPQSDLYSLGVVLYEAFTGKVPFDDPSVMSVALKHLNDPPPPPTLFNPDLSTAVETVLLRVLSKEPKDRYTTGKELAAALDHALSGKGEEDTAEIATATLQKHAQANREAEAPDNVAVTHVPPPPSSPPASIAATQKHQEPQAGGPSANISGTPTEKSANLPVPNSKPEGASRLLPYGIAVIGILIIIMITAAIILFGGYNDDDGDDDGDAVAGVEGTGTNESTEEATDEATVVAVGETETSTEAPTEQASLEVTEEQATETPLAATNESIEITTINVTLTPAPVTNATNTRQPSRTPRPTATTEASDTPTRQPSNTPTSEPTDTLEPDTDTPEPSETFTPNASDTPNVPPDIELRYTTGYFILRNISDDLLDIRLLAFEGNESGFFEASSWTASGFRALGSFRSEGCIQVASDPSTVFDLTQYPDCRYHNYFIWETSSSRHFWLDTEGNESFAVLLNGELIAECPIAESDSRATICEFALPE